MMMKVILVVTAFVAALAPQANREQAIDLARNTLREVIPDLPLRLLRAERVAGAELGPDCPAYSAEHEGEPSSGFKVLLVAGRTVYDLRVALGIATLCRPNTEFNSRVRRPARVRTGDEPSIIGEVPDQLLADIVEDLAEREGADLQAIKTVRAEAFTWNDGSLGCAQPGVRYTQATVDGYHVELKLDGRVYDYRASERGSFALCKTTATKD